MNNKRREMLNKVMSAIESGEIINDGKLLPERELAGILNMSRQHLREAIVALDALGMMDIRDRQGTFITDQRFDFISTSISSLQMWPADLYSQVSELRVMIEIPAAGVAAMRRSENEAEKLLGILKILEECYENKDPDMGEIGVKWNGILHTLIIGATHNQLMIKIYDGISELVKNSISVAYFGRSTSYPFSQYPEILLKEHSNIINAIVNRDKEGAEDAMRIHLQNAFSRIAMK